MGTSFSQHVSPKAPTPQTQAIPGREAEMAKNNAGGVTFVLDDFKVLERFLIMGTEGGSFYADEKSATVKACQSLDRCVKSDPRRVVDLLRQISDEGRCINNDYPLFALAYVMAAAEKPEDRHYARLRVNDVARIGTHILHFAEFVNQLKGWGTGTRKAFRNWYLSKTPEQLAYQYMKYKQRDGWSHRDILRLAHPKGSDEHNVLFNYITKNGKKSTPDAPVDLQIENLPKQLQVAESLHGMSEKSVIQAIQDYNLPREVIPSEMLNSIEIWRALLPSMGVTALIRNLGKMTSIGLLNNTSSETSTVVKILRDVDLIKKARVHPIQLLFALKTYASGKGFRGSLSWTPVGRINDVLNQALEHSFGYVESSGKRHSLNLDISGSMHHYFIRNSNVTPREVSVVMAMITARNEDVYSIMGFHDELIPLAGMISKNDSFESSMRKMASLPFGRTDCALPMVHALKSREKYDVFTIYTDNETYVGGIQPSQALKQYRDATGINAKLIVVGTIATNFTIADPKDPNMLDIVGFDPDTPQLISAFSSM